MSPPSAETVARGEHYMRMEGRETYRFATRTLASTALAAVSKAGWRPEDVDLFIPHQANMRIIEAVARALELPMDRMFVNLDRLGNTSAASVPIALAEAVDCGRVHVGDRTVLLAFGAGYTSGAITLDWTADPANGVRASTVRPADVVVRKPAGWDPVAPIPATLAGSCTRRSRSSVVSSPGHLSRRSWSVRPRSTRPRARAAAANLPGCRPC